MFIKTSDQQKLDLGFNNYSCNWGIHIAGLYENDDERDEIILNFLSTGAKDNDMQLYCPTEISKEEFVQKFSNFYPENAKKLDDENYFHIYSAKKLYYPNGVFSPIAMDKGLMEFHVNSQKNGPRNVRATAEMVWALDAIPGKEHLFVYESRLNYFYPGKPWVGICMYNVKKFSGSTIMNILRTHPYTISKGIFTENPYYIEPDEWLKKNAPEFTNENLYK